MLWGCVSYHAKGPLVALDGNINAARYLEVLRNIVQPELDESSRLGRRLVFQQDNAKAHTAQEVKDFMANWPHEVLEWPAQSPDLSPIELIWNILKSRLKALRPRPRTKATMRNAMMDLYDGLEMNIVQNVVKSFRKRLVECVRCKGGLVRI